MCLYDCLHAPELYAVRVLRVPERATAPARSSRGRLPYGPLNIVTRRRLALLAEYRVDIAQVFCSAAERKREIRRLVELRNGEARANGQPTGLDTFLKSVGRSCARLSHSREQWPPAVSDPTQFIQEAQRSLVSFWPSGKPEDVSISCQVVGTDPTYGFPRVCDQTASNRIFQEVIHEAYVGISSSLAPLRASAHSPTKPPPSGPSPLSSPPDDDSVPRGGKGQIHY